MDRDGGRTDGGGDDGGDVRGDGTVAGLPWETPAVPRRVIAGVAVVCLVVVASWLVSAHRALGVLAWLAADPLRFGAACVGLAAVRPLLAWPTTLLAVAVGFGFGIVGAPFALALVVLTSVPPYLFGLRTGGPGRVATAGRAFAAHTGGVRGVTASRLLPAPSDVVSVAAGVARVSLGSVRGGTALGEIPWVVAGVVAGASLDTLASGALTDVFDPRLVAGAAAGGALLLAGPLYHLGRARAWGPLG